jgi:hypothetical protein
MKEGISSKLKNCRMLLGGLVLNVLCVLQFAGCGAVAQDEPGGVASIQEFGEGGNTQMIYDRRQRPQTLYYNDLVYIVYNGGANTIDPKKGENTYPHIITYNTLTKELSEPIKLAEKNGKDQHFTPVIWMDKDDYIHILYGCHNTRPYTHLVARQPGGIGDSADDWKTLPEFAEAISYPTIYNITGNRQVIYYRGDGHRSYWIYNITEDNGVTWSAPYMITDLNNAEDLNITSETTKEEHRFIDETSSYQSVCLSKDRNYLHVAFSQYDDNKKNLPEKFKNDRYGTDHNLGIKYNLYYVKVDLTTHEVRNYDGDLLTTPMDLEYADANCRIWDTDGRGSGKPAFVNVDENGDPTFIHCLSSDDDLNKYNFWYVRRDGDQWKKTIIADANHSWSSCYSKTRESGKLHAYLVRSNDKSYSGWMDSRGGGNLLEEWVSEDKGNTWARVKDLAPKDSNYEGWRFNCIQPVRDRYGNDIDNLHVFYGWLDPELHLAKAFIADESTTSKDD